MAETDYGYYATFVPEFLLAYFYNFALQHEFWKLYKPLKRIVVK